MSKQGAGGFLRQLITNPALRSRFRAGPEQTPTRAGDDEDDRGMLPATDRSPNEATGLPSVRSDNHDGSDGAVRKERR